ncbi:MAG: 50S ribosomal protein L17 [Spirochaetes bacterium GWD1_27_9]|nr:MAG: 50S ribosomal protein L17 [Spirochaetes bacterium GWB1_27_13]OHD21046.1 MAG: 50S ribosomal protein L17 [Spirochaetes bacterium GWC1_27_15]OHD45407.1 MAG: 50S ribosomal protein L17 [Spirochaetes bacterium GWD1_27_9]
MRHLKGFRTLNRTHAHRKALFINLTEALLKKERIQTTLIKAKELRRVAEKIITRAKVKNLHNIRIVARMIKDKDILKKLFDEVAPRYVTRNGGYTRIIKLNKRKGDGSDLAFIELVEEKDLNKKKKTGKTKEKVEKKKKDNVVDVEAKEVKENTEDSTEKTE